MKTGRRGKKVEEGGLLHKGMKKRKIVRGGRGIKIRGGEG